MKTSPLTAQQQAGFLTPEPVPNWCKLSRGDKVEVVTYERTVTSGRIDMLAMDGSVLWLQQDDGKGRALFLHSDGVLVYRRPQSCKKRNGERIGKG